MLQDLTAYLFTPRTANRPQTDATRTSLFGFEATDTLVIVLYAAILSWDVYHHRPWIDEAQAWLIARDDSLRDLLLRRLHYEGAPALWHLILKAAIALHLPYAGLNWLGAAFAFAGVIVFLRFSPFPRIFRWLLPFTFYLQYQYAVIARPYVLFPLLLFLLCTVFCLETPRPVLFAVVAGLLANINAHAGILSCVFALLYATELYRRRELPAILWRRDAPIAVCLFVVLCTLSVAAAFPAPDAMVVPNATGRVKQGNPILRRLIPPETMPPGAPPLDASVDDLAHARYVSTGAATELPPPTLLQRVLHKLRVTARLTADLATFPIAESNALCVVFLILFGLWLWSRRSLRFAVPWLVTVPVAAFIWAYDHHTGIFLLALAAAAWLALRSRRESSSSPRTAAAFSVVALLVVLLQIGWTAHQVYAETLRPYDAGKQTEAFLESHYAGKRIAGFGFQSASLQPYAAHNLFFNQDHTYWLWSNANPIDLRRTEALNQRPDVVVVADLVEQQDTLGNQWFQRWPSGNHPYREMIRYWQEHGFHETHRFCGDRYMRAGVDNSLCEVIFEPDRQ